MSAYEITRRDGSISRMRLVDGVDPAKEAAKWPDAHDVVSIRKVAEFEERPPVETQHMVAPQNVGEIAAAILNLDTRLSRIEQTFAAMEAAAKGGAA